MTLGEIISRYREENKMSMDRFAQKSGLSKSYISMLEKNYNPTTGKTINPTVDVIEKAAEVMNMDFDELISQIKGKVKLPPIPDEEHIKIPLPNPELMRTVPIYGNISCGTGMFVEDEIIDYVTVPVSMLRDKSIEVFGMFAEGDSMINAGINSGDLIIFEKTTSIENGQIGCFCVDDNMATCKKFYKNDEDNIITLSPANDKYAPITITVENMGFHIVGKLVLKIGRFD